MDSHTEEKKKVNIMTEFTARAIKKKKIITELASDQSA